MSSTGFAAVDTLPKSTGDQINPRATRYGLLPIWTIPTRAASFYVWELPANVVFPFRPFIGEIGKDANDNVLYVTERMPGDQIADMYTLSRYFIELPELAKLSEDEAQQVVKVLKNPDTCSKYGFELEDGCISCWMNYLRENAENSIRSLDSAALQRAAKVSAKQLVDGFDKALVRARQLVDIAVRDIDDPKSGKSMFFDVDYLNIYHTHSERPQYRTTTNNLNIGQQIVDAFKSQAPAAPAAPAVTPEQVEALMAEIQVLKGRLGKAETKTAKKTEE